MRRARLRPQSPAPESRDAAATPRHLSKNSVFPGSWRSPSAKNRSPHTPALRRPLLPVLSPARPRCDVRWCRRRMLLKSQALRIDRKTAGFPTPHERRAAFPQRTGSLTSHCRPCNSKSRKKLKWNPVIPCISAPAAAVKQSSVNPCDSIRTALLHGDWRIVGSERGILKMYWQCCNTHPGGTAEFKQDQGNVRGNYATAIVA
jgi:hypothetical protein